jgi:SAM-dependent methyltransferase
MARYVYDQQWREERARLAGMEALWDPGTRALMSALGVAEGWTCLEVGAGGGSMSEWLAGQVGPSGRVVATDVYTKFLDAIELDNVEVRELDIVGGEPLEPEFDLVYARLVVEHLGRPALDRMVGALKPGGLLLLEDYDFSASSIYPPNELFDRVTGAVLDFMAESGFDPFFGRRLVEEMTAAGLEDVRAEGRARVYRGGTPETVFGKLSLASLRDTLVETEKLEAAEIDEALESIDDPSNSYVSALMVAAWGRRPA